jgi:hypothetical protein
VTDYDPAALAMADQIAASMQEILEQYTFKPIDYAGQLMHEIQRSLTDAIAVENWSAPPSAPATSTPAFVLGDEVLSVDPDGRWSAVTHPTEDGTGIALEITVLKDPYEEQA